MLNQTIDIALPPGVVQDNQIVSYPTADVQPREGVPVSMWLNHTTTGSLRADKGIEIPWPFRAALKNV